MEKGKYLVIEGHDGTGKSTQVELIREKLAKHGIESIEFHEPGGNPIADEIRTILKNGNLERDPMTDIMLFTSARCDLWRRIGKTAIENGVWVLSARNYYSTIAYQGYGSGIEINDIEKITKIATDDQYITPDYAFMLSLEDETERTNRIKSRGVLENPDAFESRPPDFQERVRLGYMSIAKDKKIPVISAAQSKEKICDEIWEYISKDIDKI